MRIPGSTSKRRSPAGVARTREKLRHGCEAVIAITWRLGQPETLVFSLLVSRSLRFHARGDAHIDQVEVLGRFSDGAESHNDFCGVKELAEEQRADRKRDHYGGHRFSVRPKERQDEQMTRDHRLCQGVDGEQAGAADLVDAHFDGGNLTGRRLRDLQVASLHRQMFFAMELAQASGDAH